MISKRPLEPYSKSAESIEALREDLRLRSIARKRAAIVVVLIAAAVAFCVFYVLHQRAADRAQEEFDTHHRAYCALVTSPYYGQTFADCMAGK
jgi:hypothetical protein